MIFYTICLQEQPSYVDDEVDDTTVVLREKKPSDDQDGQQTSKDGINNKQQGSKRNSLDSKTVQGLAQVRYRRLVLHTILGSF